MNPQLILAKIKAYPLPVGLVVAAILMAAVAYFRGGSLDDDEAASADLDKQSKTMANNLIFGRDLEANLKQLDDAQKGLAATLIDPDNIIENQQYFFGFERIDGLHIVDPTQETTDRDKDATMSMTSFKVQATGNWASIASFLYALQSGPHLMRVNSMAIEKFHETGPNADTTPEQISATLDLQLLGI
jgi:hypothetical protein